MKNIDYDYDIYGNKIRKYSFVKFNKDPGFWQEVDSFIPEKGFDKDRSLREVMKG